MPGFFETIRQKDAEYAKQQEEDRKNGTGDWNPDYYERLRQTPIAERIILGTGTPPHPLYGKTAGEKVSSILRWLF